MLDAAKADGRLLLAVMTFLAKQVRRGSEIRRMNLRGMDLRRAEAILRDRKCGKDEEIDLLHPTVEALEALLAVRPRYEDAPPRWPNPMVRDAVFVTVWRGSFRRISKGGLCSMVKRCATAGESDHRKYETHAGS